MNTQAFATIPVAFYQYAGALEDSQKAKACKAERERVYGAFTNTSKWDSRIESNERIIARYLGEGGQA